LNGAWRIPVFEGRRNWLGAALGGWQLSGVVKLSHGTPFTVIDTGIGDITWDGFSESRPVILDPSILGTSVRDPDASAQGLASAFRRALPGDYEQLVGRNTFYGDGVRNVDLGLIKSFYLPTNDRLLIRGEVYNVFNTIRWSFPNNDFANPIFGRITSQFNTARSVQIQARYIF
jgi:hypothetical protein